jgi:hypothetical protein
MVAYLADFLALRQDAGASRGGVGVRVQQHHLGLPQVYGRGVADNR